jgi:hypothetical protein
MLIFDCGLSSLSLVGVFDFEVDLDFEDSFDGEPLDSIVFDFSSS